MDDTEKIAMAEIKIMLSGILHFFEAAKVGKVTNKRIVKTGSMKSNNMMSLKESTTYFLLLLKYSKYRMASSCPASSNCPHSSANC